MPIYNKLVRDKIPSIIESSGKRYSFSKLDKDEFKIELKRKLIEEISEYQEASTDSKALGELADVLEIIHSLVEIHGSSIAELERLRKEKILTNGGFKQRYYLIEVEEKL